MQNAQGRQMTKTENAKFYHELSAATSAADAFAQMKNALRRALEEVEQQERDSMNSTWHEKADRLEYAQARCHQVLQNIHLAPVAMKACMKASLFTDPQFKDLLKP